MLTQAFTKQVELRIYTVVTPHTLTLFCLSPAHQCASEQHSESSAGENGHGGNSNKSSSEKKS